MSLSIIFLILVIHWIADFVIQTSNQAENKSKSMYYLLEHTLSYSLYWLVAGFIYLIVNAPLEYIHVSATQSIAPVFIFVGITFVCHTITDYFTSRLNAKLWKKAMFWGEDETIRLFTRQHAKVEQQKYIHNFFVSIGLDQLLHYVQLFLTFYFLTK